MGLSPLNGTAFIVLFRRSILETDYYAGPFRWSNYLSSYSIVKEFDWNSPCEEVVIVGRNSTEVSPVLQCYIVFDGRISAEIHSGEAI